MLERGRIKCLTHAHIHTQKGNFIARGERERERRREAERREEMCMRLLGDCLREKRHGCDDIHTSTREKQGISVGLMPVSNAMLCSLVAACPKS
jgi:hypothetical protein